jgi:hypothetical protein
MFGVERLNRNWHLYRQKIFIDVHRDFALTDYLPAAHRAAFPGNEREARLTRAVVMACHGLWQLALPEMHEVVALAPRQPWTTAERQVLDRLAGSLTTDALIDLGSAGQSSSARALAATVQGRDIAEQMLRAGRWQIHNHLQDNERAFAWQIGRALFVTLGLPSLVRLAAGRRRG